jgi:hypothetical protein
LQPTFDLADLLIHVLQALPLLAQRIDQYRGQAS